MNFILAYGYKEFLNKQCEDNQYGQFSDIKDAKQACKEDKNCSAVYDVGCGDGSIYHLCPDKKGILFDSNVSCIHEKIIVGKYYEKILAVNLLDKILFPK